MIAHNNANKPGVYRLILPKVELVNARAREIYDQFNNVLTDHEVYSFAIGMINEVDLVELGFNYLTPEVYDAALEFANLVKDHYRFSIPEELHNDECFSLAIDKYNAEADIYIFTCEVPYSYAEDKHGIDFKYLGKYFTK